MLCGRNSGKRVKVMLKDRRYKSRQQRLYLLRSIQAAGLGFAVALDGQWLRCVAVNDLAEFYGVIPRPALLATSDGGLAVCGLLKIDIWGDYSARQGEVSGDA